MFPTSRRLNSKFSRNNGSYQIIHYKSYKHCLAKCYYNHQIQLVTTDLSAREYWNFSFLFFSFSFFTFPWSCILDKSAQINIEYPHLNVSFRGKISIHELHLNYYPNQFSCNMTPERSSELNKPYGHQKGMTQQLNGEKQKSSIKSLSGDNLFCLSNLVLH